jgi:hypothetical protein
VGAAVVLLWDYESKSRYTHAVVKDYQDGINSFQAFNISEDEAQNEFFRAGKC